MWLSRCLSAAAAAAAAAAARGAVQACGCDVCLVLLPAWPMQLEALVELN
jgi:hypothetical protein